ncbi:MAG: hypothetical protein R3C49_19760 [Planctomycetaceae bacterium]
MAQDKSLPQKKEIEMTKATLPPPELLTKTDVAELIQVSTRRRELGQIRRPPAPIRLGHHHAGTTSFAGIPGDPICWRPVMNSQAIIDDICSMWQLMISTEVIANKLHLPESTIMHVLQTGIMPKPKPQWRQPTLIGRDEAGNRTKPLTQR